MNTKILSKDKDPMGAAILDYQKSGRAGRLRVLSSMFEEDEMPVKHLFRKVEEMPMLEQTKEIVHKFNAVYGETLVDPKIMLPDNQACMRLPGIDGLSLIHI